MTRELKLELDGSACMKIESRTGWLQEFFFVVVLFAMTLLAAPVHADTRPTSFEFRFRGASPGMRYWTSQGDIWTETYSSGQKSTFKVKKYPYRVNGLNGTLVGKVDEVDFFVFISDVHDSKMEVWTYKGKGPWQPLAKPTEFGPKQY